MNKYRLKKEAVPFFKKELSCSILDWEVWTKQYNVDDSALEKVEPCFVSYGHKKETGTSLKGWGNPDSKEQNKTRIGGYFHFTLHFPSMKYEEYDKFQKGNLTRDLMNEIQRVINNFYTSFNDDL